MGPEFNDLTFFEYHNIARIPDGSQAVGDDDGRSFFNEFFNGVLDDRFGLGVDR